MDGVMQVRRATVSDATAIATVHVRSWQRAYRGVFSDEFLDDLTIGPRADSWRSSLADGALVVVAEVGAELVGFSCVSASRDDDAPSDEGEVAAIYADPDRWGTGAGRALMDASLDLLAREGYREAILWVLEENSRAQRFYRLAGWTDDGVTKYEKTGGTTACERRFRIALPAV